MVGRRTGSIRFDGVETIGLPSNRDRAARHRYCPEERGIFASLNVEENLLLPPEVRAGRHSSSTQIYELFPNLKERRASQGTSSRAASSRCWRSARILRTGATLLLLDETTEGLAPVIVQQIGAHDPQAEASSGFTIAAGRAELPLRRDRRRPALRDGARPHRRHDSPNAELEAKMDKLHEYLGV